MSLLDHPEAQALLADADLTPDASGDATTALSFLQRYLPRFYRAEHRTLPRWSSAACSAACGARPASRSPSRPASPASPSSPSSALAGGTTRRSWRSCEATSARNWRPGA